MVRTFGKLALMIFLIPALALPALAAERLTVFVSIVPQQYFVQQIGKDHVQVEVMVEPGANPATYEPKPGQMAALSRAELYFAIGVPFENAWLDRIAAANPRMKVVHTEQGIEKAPMAAHPHAAETRPAHKAKAHDTGIPDPHIWLSPPLVKKQARTIMEALQKADPAHESDYAKNFKAFATAIDGLHRELKGLFADQQGLRFMVFHPAWGYFARTYGLKQVPIEIEGKSPKPAQLQAVVKQARKHDIPIIFVQPQFSKTSARVVAREINGQVAVADPLAPDWMANLRRVAEQFQSALK